jgi:hypothetical protein
MNMPFGTIDADKLVIEFSSADYTVPLVLAAIRERLDMLNEMGVKFLGVATDVPAGPSPVFRPVAIKAHFLCCKSDSQKVLERCYEVVWEAMAHTFPSENEWAEAKADYAHFTSAQADLLRARAEASRES